VRIVLATAITLIFAIPLDLAIVALVLSWTPDVALLFINEPGATVPAVASLLVLHTVTAAVVVTLLVRVARS
jgi:hypothetical protein